MDLFFLLGEKILIESLIILLKLKENKMIQMCSEVWLYTILNPNY